MDPDPDQRDGGRDSLFLSALLEVGAVQWLVRLRNLSKGGALLEGVRGVLPGQRVKLKIPRIGLVVACVAWCEGDRCGISFDEEIDPKLARLPV